jgi:hypothetical protein
MSERLVKRMIEVLLTEKELIDLGERVSSIHSTLANTRFEAKESADAFKNKIGGLQEDLSDIMTQLRSKKAYREVSCIEVKDYDRKIVNYLLGDEIVESRPITQDELQESFL